MPSVLKTKTRADRLKIAEAIRDAAEAAEAAGAAVNLTPEVPDRIIPAPVVYVQGARGAFVVFEIHAKMRHIVGTWNLPTRSNERFAFEFGPINPIHRQKMNISAETVEDLCAQLTKQIHMLETGKAFE